MNQTSSTLSNTSLSSGTDVVSMLTTAQLAWIVVLALVVVAGIIYGSRVKHRRTAAERAVKRHVEQAGVAAAPADDEGEAPAPDTPAAPAVPAAAPDAPPPAPASEAANGPVTQLKGLGPKVAARLGELGVSTVGQLAALDDDGARRLDEQLGPFRGRLERDRWVEQARFLAAGDIKGFEAVFGRL